MLRHLVDMRERALLRDAAHERIGIEALALCDLRKIGVDLGQFIVIHDVAHERKRKERFHAAGGAADDRDRARGRDGGAGRIAVRLAACGKRALFIQRERAALLRKRDGCRMRTLVDEAHHVVCDLNALFGIIRDTKAIKHVRKAHHAKADLARGKRHLLDLRQRVLVHFDHVVEEVDRRVHRLAEKVVIDLIFSILLPQHARKVQRTEVAAFIRQERLFAAGVCGFDLARYLADDVVAVHAVQEHDAGFPVVPRHVHDEVKHLAGVLARHDGFIPRVDEVIFLVALHGFHKLLREAHGNVEVCDLGSILFALDKINDVRVIHAQDAHVCATARTALFDGLSRRVEHLHEADRAGGYTARGTHRCTGGPEPREGEARSAAALMDERRVLHRLKDLGHGIRHRQHEACGKLAERLACVHQRRRVWHEQELRHDLIKLVRKCGGIRVRVVFFIARSNRIRNTAEHALRRFNEFRCFISGQVSAFQHGNGVFAQARHIGVSP